MADKITQVYNAYKADGATRAQSEQQFRNWMYGDNYRRGVWNDLRKQGAQVGTFEHFTEALGYKMNPKVKSKVAKQAIQYGAPKVPDNWGQMDMGRTFANDEMEQQLETQRNNQASSNAKKTGSNEPIAQRVKEKLNRTHLKEASKSGTIMNPLTGEPINNVPTYREKKEGKYWNPITETDMGDAVLDWSTTDANGDKVAQTQTKQNFEADAAAKAIANELTKTADYKGKWAKFDSEFEKHHGLVYHPAEYEENKKYREEGFDDNSKMLYEKYAPKLEDVSALLGSKNAKEAIVAAASKLGITPDDFLNRYVVPATEKANEEEYHKRGIEHFMPKNAWENMKANFAVSSLGNAANKSLVPEEYQNMRNEAVETYSDANSKTLDEKGVFSKEGIQALGRNISGGTARVMPDAVGFVIAGAEAKGVVKGLEIGWKALRGTGLVTKVLGKAVPKTLTSLTKKYGAQTAGRILNAVNNESIGSFIQANARQFAQGSLTMGIFEANNYLATEGREKIKEGKWGEFAEGLYTSGMSGLGTGMLFSGIGTVTGALGRNLGVTGRETTRLEKLKHGTEKALFSASALFVEGLGFRAEDLYDEAKKGELTFGSVLENGGKGVIDKITMDLGMAAGKGKRPSLKQMVVGAVANTNPHVKFSAVEKNELMKSTGGKSLFEALDGIAEGKNVSPVYRTKMSEFFNDPNISRRTKQKVAYVVGKTIDTNMPRTERVSISQGTSGTQEVRTYSKDGELLTVDVYKNAEAAEVAKQEIYAKRDKNDFIALWVDSLKPTQSENNTALENTAKELGYDDVGVFLADWDEAQKSSDADFLSKVSKTINENIGKIVADRHKQMLDAKRAINEEYDVDIDKVLDKNPVMWKDKEREAVKELGSRLKKGFSDKNDEAHNNAIARQDGADLSEQTELEDSEKVIESSQAVNERLDSAVEAWRKMQEENPDLAEWMKNNPDSTVEELRENFGDYVADAYMELSNAKAMRDGFIQNTGEKIEDAVKNQVEQAKFTGTMQNKEGSKVVTDNSVTVFADKDGNEYTLVGGDVIVDSAGDGSYSAGKSGLVIFRDKDGNLIQRTNFDGLNEVGTFSLEDYANRIRTTLQEQKTAEIQSTETPLPESQNKETPKEELPSEAPKSEEPKEEDFIRNSNSEEKLSSEKDEWGNPLIKASDGSVDFGEISEGYGLQAAPIRLSLGENKKNPETGKDEGYGLLHIEARHGDQIRKAGFNSIEEFVESIARDYTEIREGVQIGTTQTYLIVKKDGHANTLYIELSRDGKYWNVNSAGIFKEKYVNRKNEIKPEPTVGSSTSTDTTGVNHGLNEGATVTSGNSPMISDSKDTTKSSDLQEGNETLTFKNTEAAKEESNYEKNDIPMDNEGEPVYEQVPKERTAQDLFDKLGDGNVAHNYAQIRIEGAEKELKEAKKKEPKIGTKINEYLKKKQEYEDRVKAAEDKVAYWESVKEEIEKLTHTTPEELKEAQEELDGTAAREEYKKTVGETQPADGVSLAAEFVVDARITPESFRKETGLSAADQRTFVGMIAGAEKGGKSIERLGEELVEYDNAYYGGAYFHGDSNDARSAIISALMSAKSRKGLREMAQPDMEREVRERARMRDEAYHERYGMDYEEYLSYSEQEMPHILGKLNNFDEQKYLQDKAEEITNQINKEHGKTDRENDSSREESVHGAGDKVLPEERIDDRGRGESPKEHGGREKAERRGNTEDAPLHETPSGGEVEKGERKEEKPSDPSDAAEGMRGAAEQFHEERVEKARKAYEEAKASGDVSETKRTKDEYRKALDDKLKAQGIGLIERRKTIAKEMGEEPKVEKPKGEGPKVGEKQWEDMTPTERAEKADADPLTEDEIRSDEDNKELAAAAIAYLNGDKSLLNQIAYLKIYGNVRSRHEDVPGNSGTEDTSQLAATDNGGGEGMELESGRGSGGTAEPMDRGAGGETAPGKQESGETGKGNADTPAGEGSHIEGEGGAPGLGGLPAGSGGRTGSGNAGSTGSVGRGRGRGSGSRPSKSNGKRKPAAKQGTTFPNSKGRDVKQETKDAKAAMLAAFAEFNKRNKKDKNILSSSFLLGLEKHLPTAEALEYLPDVMKATGRYGVALIGEGIYKTKEWIKNVREAIFDVMKEGGFSDADIDEYIREMWHMPWEMDGETHKIGEWASIKGYAGLRESLKEPLRKKFDKQVLAEPTEVKVGDRKNIEETLPFLLPQQQDDVLKAETQFFDESHKDKAHANGKGYMFTNGTGTGKTYTGLGIIKRMVKQGKGRILIITPSQQKVKDWINDGKNLCLDIRDLDDWANERGSTATNEKGDGVVITTFANFGTNKRLLEDQFDAIVYDESHRIMENKNATETARSRQHYMLSNRNESYALMRLEEINPDCMKMRGLAEDFEDARKKEVERIQAEYRKEHPSENEKEMRFHTSKSLPKDIHSFSISDKAKFPELGKIYEDYIKARDYYINNVKPKLEKQAKESVDKTKVVFLSATPFNTRENIEYAEGYLFSYPERNEMGQSGKTQFFLEHFGAGYKYRYHRLESSTSNAEALAKQEIAFSDWLQNDLGTMSGRVIDSPFDYSRDFPTVSVEHADEFNTACEEISRDKIFGDAYRKVLGDYNYGSALFETMKVSALLPRLREHLAAGRKIVIFHRRVTSKEPLKAPFGMILGEQAEQTIKALPKEKQPEARTRLNELRDRYSGLLEWEKTLDFSMPREQLAKAFGEDNVLYFSGSENKKVKSEAVKQFNDDNSGKNIIVIQEASGKEGISLHDTTGKHQRVCITLALPQSPITALQIEGRTYRIGNESNAIFEYPVLGLTSEYNLFASKFNRQVSTTENLALGSQARNLRDSFARGIEEHSGVVPIDQQGVGGKEFDKGDANENDPFDNAVLDYYTNQRLNKNNREGVDYFPTPEPLGYKMVEWANIGEGDSVLEPSAGHGAIARYVPQSNELVAIEPSMSLFAKLQMKAGGLGRKFQNETFEAYHISNKHDTIVMNPPFGHAGATAIAHIEKAFGHLEEGGRMVAIIPRGAMDKKFDKWYDNEKTAAMRAEVDLPDIVFQQAGTSVRCRVVVVDKITDSKLREQAHMEKADLSGHYDKIEDFFNDLRNIEVPDRIIDTNFKMQKMSKSAVKSLKEIRDVWSADVDKDGVHVRTSSWMGYDISFTGSEDPKRWKDKMAATYDKYAQMEKSELREGNKAVFGELKELACKLAGMTEDEMRRYLVSKGAGSVKFRKNDNLTPEERRSEERMEEHHVEVAKAAENLNTKVNVCVDINDVTNAEARSAIERGEKVKAWYDTRTGEVHVYLPNVTDKYDAQMSVAHEVVAHKGMRGLLGEEGYRSMMRRMYTHLSNEEAKEVNERMMKNGWDFYTAMDEWVADKAEESVFTPKYVVMKDGLHRYPLDKVFHIVTEAMHDVGYRINPNVDDVKYWLWASKKGLKNGDAYTEMKRNSFLWRLNHNTSNDGIENGEFVETGGVRFSNGNSKLNGEDSEKLFASLQNKKGKEYYDTVTEIARRVVERRNGKATVLEESNGKSESDTNESFYGGFKSVAHCAASIITHDVERSVYADVANRENKSRGSESAGEGLYANIDKNVRSQGLGAENKEGLANRVNREIFSRLKDWAEQNHAWLDRRNFGKKYPTSNKIGEGEEAEVYLSKDGKSVLKIIHNDTYLNPVGSKLDELAYENIALGDNERKVIGFMKDPYAFNDNMLILVEQPYVEGKTVDEIYGGDTPEALAFIDKVMKDKGFEVKETPFSEDLDDWLVKTYYNRDFTIRDVNTGNVIVDKDGKPHVIDVYAFINHGEFEKYGDNSIPANTANFEIDFTKPTNKSAERKVNSQAKGSGNIRFRKDDKAKHESTLFRKPSLDRSKNDTPLMSATKDSIDKALNNWNARRIECWTDDKHGLRVFQQKLAEGLTKGMNDSMDSYHGAINQSSIVREKQYQFETRELKTMNDAVKECTRKLGGGMEGYEELNKYAYVKSGLERNRVLFVRDAAEQVDKKIMKLNKEALDKDPQATTLAKMGVEEFRDAFHSEKKFQETLLNSGKISLAEYYKALDDFIKGFSFPHTGDAGKNALIDKLNDWYADKIGGKYDENENDYSGIRKFDDFDSDAERIDYVMNTEATLGEGSKNKLWQGIGGVTRFAIDNDYNYGVISKDVHSRVSSMFSWYIPMRGFKEDTMEDMYAYMHNEISDGGNVSSVVKRADGRTTLADSPLGTAAALAERSISNGEDNRNKQRLYRLVNQWLKDHTTTNEDGKIELTEEAPAVISEVWYKKVTDHTTGETYWEAVMPDIDGEKDPKQIRAKVERFEENMRNAEKNGNATRTLQKGTFAKPFKVAKHKNEHVVFVNVNGKQKMIIMQGNPRPAQAINGDTASDVTAGRLMRGMSAMFTSYNITFSVTNTSRDTFFANNNVAIRENAAYYARFVKNQALMGGSMLQGTVMMNMPKVKGMYYQLWSDYKKGKKLTGKYGKYFEEYMNNGGKTGFVQTKTIEDLEKHIRNEATQKMLSASTLGKVMSKVPEVIEALNERSENMNRFACYVTSREMGRSVMRSVSDAKEVSTNFNRKGSGSKAFKGTNAKAWEKWQGWLYDRAKSYYLFFNAGMQGLSVLTNNFVRHKVKTAAFAVGIPILFASSIIPALNSWIASCFDEDDQYDNLSEWERRNNICIYAGHSNWVKVPLPIELRAFYGFGDIALGVTNPAFRSEKGLWLDMLSQVTQILPVDFMGEGGDFWGALMPDVAKPLYHVWVNRDWTGKPIYKDYDYLKYEPEYQKVFQGENEWFVSFSKFINEMSGGNEHVKGSLDGKWNNPAIWGEIITGYGGGALSDAIRTGKLATRVATWNWEDFSTREVPMVRALYSSATEKTKYYRSLSKYAHYKEDADKYLHDFKANLKSDNPLYVMKAISDMKRESPEFVRMAKIHGFEKSIKDLKKIANNEKIPKKARDEAKELINQEKVKLVKEFESDE
jgi:predicted RNA methylase